MNRIILAILIFVYTIGTIYGQRLVELNKLLDSIPYYDITDIDYTVDRELPDTIKEKVLDLLKGYLPPQVTQKITEISRQVQSNISRQAWSISSSDSIRYIQVRDSLVRQYKEKHLKLHKSRSYPENFILAIGSWNIREAKSILHSKLEDPRFPKFATLLALSKLGDNQALDSVMKLLEVKDTSFIEIIPRGYISEQKYQILRAGRYLKNRSLLSHIVDLLDIEGKAILFDGTEPVPGELLTTLELSLCFIEKKYIDNGSLSKWEEITDQFYNSINQNLKNPPMLRTILSPKNKLQVKAQLRNWIETYVVFE